MENISAADLRTCVRVLTQIQEKAEKKNGDSGLARFRSPVMSTVKK
jgi:hypothetical protein